MPIYEYQCDACGKRFEQIQKFADAPVQVCPQCGKGPVQRLMSAPAFQFKGSGWYITDYAKKGGDDAAPSGDKAGKGDSSDKAGKPEKADKSEKTGKTESTSTSEKTESKPAASESTSPKSTTE